MNAAVCTLFEGHYHYGLGALVNSLCQNGYRGVIWAGYRGVLPPWASPVHEVDGFQEFRLLEGCAVRFTRMDTPVHFAYCKPAFMLELFRKNAPEIDTLFYFDPDIVVKCSWAFYQEWAACGVAVVQEIVNGNMSSTHPFRTAWARHGDSLGFPVRNQLDRYFNSGFIGVRRDWSGTLEIWRRINESLADIADVSVFACLDCTSPFHGHDQEGLNMALMFTDSPLSMLGPEGMDFFPGGFAMSHATGTPKPWRKKMLWSALSGLRPTPADKAYWRYTQAPIQLFSERYARMKRLDISLGAAVGRVYRRA